MPTTGDPFGRVQPGDTLRGRHAAWNGFLDTYAEVQRRQLNGGTFSLAAGSNQIVLAIRNDTAEAVDRFGVLGLGDPLLDPSENADAFDNLPAFHGVAPVAGTHEGLFAVLLEPLLANQIGAAVFAGVVRVGVAMNDVNHKFAEIKGGETAALESREEDRKLAKARGSAQILWVESGTGIKKALVRLGFPQSPSPVTGQVKIAALSPLTCDVWTGLDGSYVGQWDANGGSHYAAHDSGNGCVKVGDVFPITGYSQSKYVFASAITRLGSD